MALSTFALSDLESMLAAEGVAVRREGQAQVKKLFIDSRKVVPGSLFLCKGAAFKPAYLTGAAAAGATAYVCDDAAADALAAEQPGMPRLVVGDMRHAMGLLAPMVFCHPDQRLNVVGITGTKGKSTVAYMMRSILVAAGAEPSILGSIDTDDGIEHFESHNTTPEAPDLWRHLANTEEAGRSTMVMEVSSHGLKYDRVLGLHLGIGCFLNIGRDHISAAEHPDFEDYFASKLKMFNQCETAVVNLGTEHLDEVLAAAAAAPHLVTFGVHNPQAAWRAENVRSTGVGIAYRLVGPEVERNVFVGITGLFNVENSLAAIVMARLLGVGWEAIDEGLAHLRVPGRMELVANPDKSVIAIVDYAHNALSFKALFSSVKEEYPNRAIIAVFGAPGCKAYERRQQLPEIAAQYTDLLIYTEEDPAHDPVEEICAQMASFTPAGAAYEIILDREEAVARSIEVGRAMAPSVVLLLAKGDETRQHRGDEFPEVKSDLALARELLER